MEMNQGDIRDPYLDIDTKRDRLKELKDKKEKDEPSKINQKDKEFLEKSKKDYRIREVDIEYNSYVNEDINKIYKEDRLMAIEDYCVNFLDNGNKILNKIICKVPVYSYEKYYEEGMDHVDHYYNYIFRRITDGHSFNKVYCGNKKMNWITPEITYK